MGNENNPLGTAGSEEIAEPSVATDAVADEDVMLPDDYEEGKPYSFEEPEVSNGDAPDQLPEENEPSAAGAEDGKAEAEVQPAADQPGTDTGDAGAPEKPAGQESEPVSSTYKFTDTFQGMSREVELDLKDIPTMYRKAQTADFVVLRTNERERRARALGYESVDDMLTKVRSEKIEREVAELMDDNVHETIARDVVGRKYPEFAPPVQLQPQQYAAAPAQPARQVRNIGNELSDLFAVYPALRGQKLPQEVTSAAMGGKSLLDAYNGFLLQHNNEEASRLRKENETLKQNAAAAARAPVKSVTEGGTTDTKSEDVFLKGFNFGY